MLFKTRDNGRKVFAQSGELYADIVFADEERRELLKFIEHNEKLAEMMKNDDKKGFIKEFEAVTDFFGKFASQTLKESGYLINRLADRFCMISHQSPAGKRRINVAPFSDS